MIFVQHRPVPVSPFESLFLLHPALLSMASQDEDDQYLFTMDIPGVKEGDINVTVQGTKLKVVGERKRDDKMVVSRYIQEFELDNKTTDTQGVQATLMDGVLTVVVPKKHIKDIPQPSCFDVKVESTDAPAEDDEKDEAIRLTFDLPGVKVADMKVSITDEKLILDAERKKRDGSPMKFHRTMILDSRVVDTGRVQAFLADGVLTLILGRKEAEPVQTIPISTAENVTDVHKDKIGQVSSENVA